MGLEILDDDVMMHIEIVRSKGAMYVQRFHDLLSSASHVTHRISLRFSSMPEPRDALVIGFEVGVFCAQRSSI